MTAFDARRRAIAATLLPGFVGTELPGHLRARLADGLGGVCVFGPNIASAEQLRRLNDDILATAPLAIIAVDEEGGDVTRLNYADGSPYPGNAVLGRLDDERLTREIGRDVGAALRRVSCTLDFAPDVDVNSNPDNPVIGVRSFGADAALVARHSAAWTAGIQSAGVAACAKHFPGHGDTALDSHLALPVIDRSLAELRERELVPFRAAIAAGTLSIMTSHIVLPQVDAHNPATFSSRILQGLLREELGFDGVIVSDALDMKGASGATGIPEAAVRALAAGCDLLCIGTETTDELIGEIIAAVEQAIDAGRLSEERVRDAAGRVRALARRLVDLRTSIPEPGAAGAEPTPVEAVPAEPAPSEAASAEPGSAERGTQPDAVIPLERVRSAFDVNRAALEAFTAAQSAADRGAGAAHFAIVRIVTEANVAVGVAPWGPFAQAAAHPESAESRAWARHPQFVVSENEAEDGRLASRIDALVTALPAEAPVVVIGKAMHRYPFARETVDALRRRGVALAVDMGWPSDDRAYADVATFGASRAVGRALMGLLEPRSEPERKQ
jgi:beta-N-acetylhexosaminidase